MIRVNFDVSNWLVDQIDELRDQWGFRTRAEFFRHVAIEFVKKHGQVSQPDASDSQGLSGPEARLKEIMDNHIGFGIPKEAIIEIEKIAAREDC